MQPARILLPAATCILGVLLGLALAPSLSKPGNGQVALPATGLSPTAKSPAPDRSKDAKNKEHQVTVPIRALLQNLRRGDLNYRSQFDQIAEPMEEALKLLDATDSERKAIRDLVEESRTRILDAEQNHVKLGEITAHVIRLNVSDMRGPAEEITRQTMDGIRAALPNELSEIIMSSISWEHCYPTDAPIRLEIFRDQRGELMASQKNSRSGQTRSLYGAFKDNGTPLPADQIFDDRWKPLLKGVTILPKDEE